MGSSIILIGPPKAGKSTLGALLTAKLGWAHIELDDLRMEKYYPEIGYDNTYARKLRREKGFAALVAHWKPFDIHAVERVLEDFPDEHVISFGAGHSIYDDAEQFARAEKALKPFPHVVRLLYSPDIDDCIRLLEERLTEDFPDGAPEDMLAVARTFIEHLSNEKLATVTFYNADESPEETANRIIAYIQSTT